jgi:hypothetical protein
MSEADSCHHEAVQACVAYIADVVREELLALPA